MSINDSVKMEQYIKHPVLMKLAKLATQKKMEVYVIGGFVRDLFLDRPSKDIDILVIGNGIEFAQVVAESLGTNVSIFKNFGTAQIKVLDETSTASNPVYLEIEFVGARKESYQSNSRNPVVSPGTLSDDQFRRDFTINAMAIRLDDVHFGKLIDPFDGMGDLERKIIRTPLQPEETFSDDPLRMFRAIRFATQLQFHIETKKI
jgi:tRNA nucleotidyltransferase/poly(A) polymerase